MMFESWILTRTDMLSREVLIISQSFQLLKGFKDAQDGGSFLFETRSIDIST